MGELPKRRWLHFRLRTLLVLMTVAAVVSWLYSSGAWNRWRVYREQRQFESAVASLPAGTTITGAKSLLPDGHYEVSQINEMGQGKEHGYMVHHWPNAIYVLYFPKPVTPRAKRAASELFRLPPAPNNYQAQTKAGRWWLNEFSSGARLRFSGPTEAAYWSDFSKFISGDRRTPLGFKYKLVHSAPPSAKAGVLAPKVHEE